MGGGPSSKLRGARAKESTPKLGYYHECRNNSRGIARNSERNGLALFRGGDVGFSRGESVLTLAEKWQYACSMAKVIGSKRNVSERRVPRTYRLPLSKIAAAQRALGVSTATEAIEQALDLVVFQRALVDGTRAMLGVTIDSSDSEP